MMFALAITMSGCKQNEGDRCTVQSDCDDGLICVLPISGTPQSGGVCQKPGAGVDMTTPENPDLSPDLGENVDL